MKWYAQIVEYQTNGTMPGMNLRLLWAHVDLVKLGSPIQLKGEVSPADLDLITGIPLTINNKTYSIVSHKVCLQDTDDIPSLSELTNRAHVLLNIMENK